MAEFEPAYERLLRAEGGYVNDPTDPGGETYAGISRRSFPQWPGWPLVEALKRDPDFPQVLGRDPQVQLQVRIFYEREFWAPLRGPELPSQRTAEFLLQMAVNLGARRAVRIFQRSCNLLNDQERLFSDLAVDGLIGPKTLGAVSRIVAAGWEEPLLQLLAIFQGERYIALVERDPALRRFLRGWLSRIEDGLTARRDRRSGPGDRESTLSPGPA
ncbi:MAG: hypothetical protein KatS3mg115_2546 [Candidatus Poribacteria bacterium]|nr:MAG: hypothetical protein KatS3mg115_2546 [Candidatus Poribacteria bacterium]